MEFFMTKLPKAFHNLPVIYLETERFRLSLSLSLC